jgi:hypothetical protein
VDWKIAASRKTNPALFEARGRSAAPFALLQASLGLSFDPDRDEIHLINPRLPSFVDEVTLRRLRLGNASQDLAIGRHGEEVSLRVLRREGQLRVTAIHTNFQRSRPIAISEPLASARRRSRA